MLYQQANIGRGKDVDIFVDNEYRVVAKLLIFHIFSYMLTGSARGAWSLGV